MLGLGLWVWLSLRLTLTITIPTTEPYHILISVVTIPNVAMRYVSRYLGHDAIRIAILVYRVSQCLD